MRTLTPGQAVRRRAISSFLGVLWLATVGCGGPGGEFLGGPIGTAPSTGATVTIVSGWDYEPIPTTVIVDGASFTTDWDGRVELPPARGQDLDIDVAGFLPRRARHRSNSGSITLWPAATHEEAMAIRDMMYRQGPSGEYFLNRPESLLVHLDTGSLPTATAAIAHARWSAVVATLQGLGVRVSEGGWVWDEAGEVVMTFATSPAQCTDRWEFCLYDPLNLYFARGVMVASGFEARPDGILRALVSTIMREGGANPLPGMMNRERPASELSLLERQAIKMAYTRGDRHRWPDTDPERTSVP